LPNGIETTDGFRELDVIVCATGTLRFWPHLVHMQTKYTGFDTSFQLGFPIIGRGGVQLSEKYKPHPKTYLSVAVDGFPNWFQSLGPNSAVGKETSSNHL
jgi:cation diffusion facilitator CzcD-associated flavoprotein CzcO